MTKYDILVFAKQHNYAALYLLPTGPKCGPGKARWQRDMRALSKAQQYVLATRIARFVKYGNDDSMVGCNVDEGAM